MRVGIFSPTYPGINGEGGIGTYTRSLGRSLSSLGHEVHVLTIGDPGRASEDSGVKIHTCNYSYVRGVDKALPGLGAAYHIGRAMKRLSREHAFDVVEFPNWEGRSLWYSIRRPAPVVIRLHTSSAESQKIDQAVASKGDRWDVRREFWSSRMADSLVTHSSAHRAMMAEELGVGEGSISVIPHGIDVDPDFVRPAEGTTPTVVFLGRMERRKGSLDLLKAIPAVLESVPDARFHFIGSDRAHCPGGKTHVQWSDEELPSHAREAITFHGRLPDPDVDRWLQTASVFVAPSLYESFGLIFLEAMRWGTPVIGTTVGGIPEIIEDDVSGLLVSPENPDQLSSAIIRLLRDPELRRRLGTEGRSTVKSRFSADLMGRRVAEFYGQVASGSKK